MSFPHVRYSPATFLVQMVYILHKNRTEHFWNVHTGLDKQ